MSQPARRRPSGGARAGGDRAVYSTDPDRNSYPEQVYRVLVTVAREARTWVTSEQVRVALEQSGTTLRSTDINAVRVRLRTLATTRQRGAVRTQMARVERAERLIAPGRTAAFWWPLELGTPAAPPGVASRAHGLRLAVAMAVRALGRPVHLRELKIWARAHAQIPEATLLLEPGAIPLLQKTIGYDQRQIDNPWGLHRVLPLDRDLEQAGTYVTCGQPNQADRLAVSLVVALERYQPAIDYEQILALRADRSLAMPALTAWAETRAGAARYAFAKALGRCDAYPEVDATLRQLAERELARSGQLIAWHAHVTEGNSDRFRDGRVIAERVAHHAAMLPQLLDLPHTLWRGIIKGPGTAVAAESLRPLVEWVAEHLGDSAEGRMARWVDVAPRLTPSTGVSGGAGRQLLVDQLDGLMTICERLPMPTLSAAMAAVTEVAGPIVRDAASISALRNRVLQCDRSFSRAADLRVAEALMKRDLSALQSVVLVQSA
ncbi:hypothetical protein [Gemmatimonas sp.]|uniref:hypothetical protein n=1 Tax=Gemmatimonas sp. TaxID=1962908 RepID=UPI003DA244FD